MSGVDVNGFKIEISADVIKRITDVDDAIARIQKNAGSAAKGLEGIRAALGGIDATQITAVANAVQKLSETKVNIGFSQMRSDTQAMLQNVTDMVTKLSSIKGIGVTTKTASSVSTSTSTSTSTSSTAAKEKLLTEQQILKLMQNQSRAETEANNIRQKSIQLKQQGKDITQKEGEAMLALVNRSYSLTTQLEKQQRINPANYYLAAQRYAEQLRKEEEKITKERQKQYAQTAKSYQSQNYAQNTTLTGAVNFASTANTLNRLTTAQKYLKEAMAAATPNTAEWEKANRAYQETKNKIDAIRKSMGEFKEAQSGVLNISDQLTRRLALLFSVSAIQNFISKLVKVRAEFELQQISLRSILQDKTKADAVFAQVQQLALQSPFSIMQLNTFTKQVAAYGFEAEKLVDTTKRLADVSAGLGVDMGRLTLAYGQVKTANYLRATEVRQFTEAGLNITAELAKYFSELRGEMVNVADVTDMITKRMVRFEDVEEVFKRITSEGGMFYDMQKKQAEGLAGQIQRIGDATSIMLNEIGKSNQGGISFVLKTIRALIQNWETVAVVVRAATVTFAAYAVSATRAAVANGTFTASATGIVGALFKVTAGLKAMGAALMANPWALVITGIAAAGFALWDYVDKVNAAQKAHEEFSLDLTKQKKSFDELTKHINENNQKLKESEQALKDAGNDTGLLNAAIKENRDLMTDQNATVEKLRRAFPALSDSIKQAKNGIVDLSEAIDNFNSSERLQRFMNFSLSEEGGNDSFTKKLENYSNSMTKVQIAESKLQTQIDVAISKVADLIVKRKSLGREIENELLLQEKINNTYASDASVQEKAHIIFNAMSDYQRIYGGLAKDVEKLGYALQSVTFGQRAAIKKRKKAEEEIDEIIMQNLATEFNTTVDNLNKLTPIQKEQARQATQDFLEKSQIALDDLTRDLLNRQFRLKIGIDFVVSETQEEPKTYLQQKIDDYVEEHSTANFANNFTNALPSRNTGETAEAYLKRLTSRIKEVESEIKQTSKASVQLNKDISNKDRVQQLESDLKVLKEMQKAFGLEPDEENRSTGRDTTEEDARKRFEFFKRANSEYEKLLKWYGKEEAKMRILNQMRSEAKALGIESIFNAADFEKAGTVESMQKVFDTFYANAGKHTARIKQDLEKNISPLKIELDFELQQKELDTLSKQFDSLFSGYELYLELDKTGLDKKWMSDLFGVDAFSLDEVQERSNQDFIKLINEQQKRELQTNEDTITTIEQAKAKAGATELKMYEDNQKKITDAFKKEMQARLKEYSKYLTQAYSEAGQIRLKTLQDLANINTLKDANGKDIDENTKQVMREGVMRDAQKELDKQAWEGFKEGNFYTQMFEDLEKVSTSSLKIMMQKLEEYKTSLKNLDPSQLKDIQTQYKKIEEVVKGRNPFKTFGESAKNLFTTFKSSKEAQTELKKLTEELDKLEDKKRRLEAESMLLTNDEYANLKKKETSNKAQISDEEAKGDEADSKLIEELEKQNKKIREQIELLEERAGLLKGETVENTDITGVQDELSKVNEEIGKTKENQQKTNEKANAWKKALSDASASFSGINSYTQSIGDALNNFKGAWEDAFGPMSDSMQDFFDDMNYVLDGLNTIDQGLSQIVSGNVIAGAINTVTGVFKSIGGLFGVGSHDKKLQRQIEKQIKLVNRLQRAYEDLEEDIENAFSFNQLTASTNSAIQNLKEQNVAYQEMINKENSKKNSDSDQIQEWQDAIEDNNKLIQELQQSRITEMGGLGTGSDVKSAAENFVDAWMEAYQETGDGLSGLKKSFDEFFVDLIKKQMVSKVAEMFIGDFAEKLNAAVDSGSTLTTGEVRALVADAAAKIPALAELLKQLSEAMEEAGVNFFSTDGSSLSGLTEGIQGVTEDTALVLEALLNSMRFYVADTNAQVREISQLIVNPPADNLFLTELKLQTSELKAIHEILNSVTRSGHPQGGTGLKVFLD